MSRVYGDSVPSVLPVLSALRPVFPEGGPRAGTVLRLDTVPHLGGGALGLALAAGATAGDGWCAVVGMPEFGVLAATGMGADPDRLLLVADPGRQWPEVVAALADGVRFILLRPAERPAPALARRLNAVIRRHGCVLAVSGGCAWEGAALTLRVSDGEWTGLGDGHGHLRGRRARVSAYGRGGGERSAWVWLPGPDGAVTSAEAPAVAPAEPVRPVRRIA